MLAKDTSMISPTNDTSKISAGFYKRNAILVKVVKQPGMHKGCLYLCSLSRQAPMPMQVEGSTWCCSCRQERASWRVVQCKRRPKDMMALLVNTGFSLIIMKWKKAHA